MPAVRELIMLNVDSLGNDAANSMREAVLNSESLSAALVVMILETMKLVRRRSRARSRKR